MDAPAPRESVELESAVSAVSYQLSANQRPLFLLLTNQKAQFDQSDASILIIDQSGWGECEGVGEQPRGSGEEQARAGGDQECVDQSEASILIIDLSEASI